MRRAALLVPVVLLLAEIFVISLVGSRIGAGNTILLLLAGVVAGGLVIRYEGRRVLARAAVAASDATADPAAAGRAAADAGLVVLGGLLLIFPGFITDALGLLCVLPFTRPLLRKLIGVGVAAQVARRTRLGAVVTQARQAGEDHRMHRPDGKVIQGEVVEGEVVDDKREPDA